MAKARSLLATGILALFSATAFASSLPSEICRPAGSHTIKADHQGNGEPEYKAKLFGRCNSIPSLTKRVIIHARSKSLHVVESEVKHNDADLKFKRGGQELDVSIKDRGQGRIGYKADLDLDKN